MTAAVDHSRDHDLTVAGTQAACGWALHLLATENHRLTGKPLPVLMWVIEDKVPSLSGWVLAAADRRQAVRDWADHLGTQVTETAEEDDVLLLETKGVAHGVPVRVWTRICTALPEVA